MCAACPDRASVLRLIEDRASLPALTARNAAAATSPLSARHLARRRHSRRRGTWRPPVAGHLVTIGPPGGETEGGSK